MLIGTLRQLLASSRSDSGPILNALSFPLPLSGAPPSQMSTEIEAWRLTEGELFCPSELQFPVGDMRWGLAATTGARHWLHIDSDGFGTYIDVQTGQKWWIVFNPPANGDKRAFGNIEQFLHQFDTNAEEGSIWDIDDDDSDTDSDEDRQWIAEAICLSEGSRL